jgi:hypothetical protein
MRLARNDPGPIGFARRQFECPKCESVQTDVIARGESNNVPTVHVRTHHGLAVDPTPLATRSHAASAMQPSRSCGNFYLGQPKSVRSFQGEHDHTLGHLGSVPGNPRGARPVSQQAVDALFHETLLPAPDTGLRRAGLAHDLVGPDAVGAQKHNVYSPNVLLRRVTVPGDRFKSMAIWSCNLDGNPGAHA